MAAFDYVFLTRWRMQATVDEVWDILVDAASLPRWWPAVYMDVHETSCGGTDNSGIGTEFTLTTRGWLPYILRWSFRVTDVERHKTLALDAYGDFAGRGVWSFSSSGDTVDIEYDWRVRADKPLIKWLSPILKPIFQWNHQWAMRTGETSLRMEILRRRARSDAKLNFVGLPPKPSKSLKIISAGTAFLGILMLIYFIKCSRKPPF